MRLIFALLSLSLMQTARADEIRSLTFHRLGHAVNFNTQSKTLPHANLNAPAGGALIRAVYPTFNSLWPYEYQTDHFKQRPPDLEDLYYEPLMIKDPVGGTETLYPLIAKALRYSSNFSSVVFELNPEARFQDGSVVTPSDLIHSLIVRFSTSGAEGTALKKMVKAYSVGKRELRITLHVAGLLGREAIADLAQTRILRPRLHNTGSGGLPIPFQATGPYRLTSVSSDHAVLDKNPTYWGRSLPVRRGLLHFQTLEFYAYSDKESMREAPINFQRIGPHDGMIDSVNPSLAKTLYNTSSADNNSYGRARLQYSFNMNRPWLKDQRVRHALVLAFDFNRINAQHFASSLKRTTDPLFESARPIKNPPSPQVIDGLDACHSDAQSSQTFSLTGDSPPETDHAKRLAQARSLLQEAGYGWNFGSLTNLSDPNQNIQRLRILIRDDDEFGYISDYARDLESLGFHVEISKPLDRDQFANLLGVGDYDLATTYVNVTDLEGWSKLSAWKNLMPDSLNPCLKGIYGYARFQPPNGIRGSETYQTIARIYRDLDLSIPFGEPRSIQYAFDTRLRMPDGVPMSRVVQLGWFDKK